MSFVSREALVASDVSTPTSWLAISNGSSIPENEEKLHRNGEHLVISLWKRLLAESRTLVIGDISKWMDEDSWIPRDGTARDGRVCFEFTTNQGQKMFIGKQFTLVRVLTGDSTNREQTIRNEYKVRI